MKNNYIKLTTEELLDFVEKENGRCVEARIINGQISVTHFIYYDGNRKRNNFNDEGCDGESRWVSRKRFLKDYPTTPFIWYVDKHDHEEQKNEDDTILGYVVFVVSSGIVNYTHFNLLSRKEAIERGLHLVRDQYDNNTEHVPRNLSLKDYLDDEMEELDRRETAVRNLQSVDLTPDDDLVIMPVNKGSWQ